MSCDHAVWYPSARLTDAEAGALYHALCDGRTEGVVPHPAIAAFYEELTSIHPEIDDVPGKKVDDGDPCPWSIAFDRSDAHLIICCVWPKANYVGDLLRRLAKKHGLALYDPQSERVVYPDDLPRRWWKFWG
jgi:hypothetical protein